MALAKLDATSTTSLIDKDIESDFEWFDLHKRSFYALGLSYLRTQEQMEELFYRSIIKVQKELPRYKSDSSFETRVTSIFISICRELSSDKSFRVSYDSEPTLELFTALDLLNEVEKEAVALTYIKGISQEEAAHILNMSEEKLKEHLFYGIQTLRKGMGFGSSFNGCKEYYENYMYYLERKMERSDKIEFEKHIYHCQDCQEDLATFQKVMLNLINLTESMRGLLVPSNFMENIKSRLVEKEKQRQQKINKRKKVGLIFASVIILLMSLEVFKGTFSNFYFNLTEEDQQLSAFIKQDLGERLNLVAESGGVKIKIKSVIADDIQTLVFYEIEDEKQGNQYVMNYDDGVVVEKEYKIMNQQVFPMFSPPNLKSAMNKKEKNVYHGKLSLRPLKAKKEVLNLKITKLYELHRSTVNPNEFNGFEVEFATGEWNFKIPVTKHKSKEYVLNEETKVQGIPIRINKLTIAPTATVLQYAFNNVQKEQHIEFIDLDYIKVNNKKVKSEMYGSSYVHGQQNQNLITLQTHFVPLNGEKPRDIYVKFKSVQLMIKKAKTINIDISKEYPQTFDYAGSTISIDKVDVGQPTTVVLSNHEIKNREYNFLQLNFVGKNEIELNSSETNSEGVLVDKNGVVYDLNKNPLAYEEIEEPRYFTTVQNIELQGNSADEKVIPTKLKIYGYNSMKYLDDVVKIKVK